MRHFLFLFLLFGASILADCQSSTKEAATTEQGQSSRKKHHRRHYNKQYQQRDSSSSITGYQQDTRSTRTGSARRQAAPIPRKAYDVLAYVRANGRAMDGYVGGRRFGNFENHLPRSGPDGKPIDYQEWDVNPKVPGQNRGTERLITGSDGRAWYTSDHYNTFTELK
ncbi:ribonuclease domain-containing protein [Fibrella aquatilis]|uniref:Ribonuclease n=1 Tax=Fibrella aquatilis TaxID=2817059 RepID=A0A939K145_9BACT|nr:ribonuclease domain-containing protein [Fibrella aquatilis]MBO0932666.1 ribonuclease [Fibrella aquatilis]